MVNKAKFQSENDGLRFLSEAFTYEQRTLEAKIQAARSTIPHDPTMGSVVESQWINEFLTKYLPDRYAVTSGIVVDSEGTTSDQIDVVIHDNQYTPNLLSQGSHQFIPAESVYAVLEVKPQIDKRWLHYAGNKAASVRRLKRTSVPIRHVSGKYPPKALHHIVSGIIAVKTEWQGGLNQTFKDHLKPLLLTSQQIDCGCTLENGAFDIFNGDQVFFEDGPVDPQSFETALHIRHANNSLVYFMFRLLTRLQSIGTVPAVDWGKYADVFDHAQEKAC